MFYMVFMMLFVLCDGVWLYESLWYSICIIFWGFVILFVIGVLFGIVCGIFSVFVWL